jgi:hypothetical protein
MFDPLPSNSPGEKNRMTGKKGKLPFGTIAVVALIVAGAVALTWVGTSQGWFAAAPITPTPTTMSFEATYANGTVMDGMPHSTGDHTNGQFYLYSLYNPPTIGFNLTAAEINALPITTFTIVTGSPFTWNSTAFTPQVYTEYRVYLNDSLAIAQPIYFKPALGLNTVELFLTPTANKLVTFSTNGNFVYANGVSLANASITNAASATWNEQLTLQNVLAQSDPNCGYQSYINMAVNSTLKMSNLVVITLNSTLIATDPATVAALYASLSGEALVTDTNVIVGATSTQIVFTLMNTINGSFAFSITWGSQVVGSTSICVKDIRVETGYVATNALTVGTLIAAA